MTATGFYILQASDLYDEKVDNTATATGTVLPTTAPATKTTRPWSCRRSRSWRSSRAPIMTEIEEPGADVTYTYLITNLSRSVRPGAADDGLRRQGRQPADAVGRALDEGRRHHSDRPGHLPAGAW